jgi:hypothetical protein
MKKGGSLDPKETALRADMAHPVRRRVRRPSIRNMPAVGLTSGSTTGGRLLMLRPSVSIASIATSAAAMAASSLSSSSRIAA